MLVRVRDTPGMPELVESGARGASCVSLGKTFFLDSLSPREPKKRFTAYPDVK